MLKLSKSIYNNKRDKGSVSTGLRRWVGADQRNTDSIKMQWFKILIRK